MKKWISLVGGIALVLWMLVIFYFSSKTNVALDSERTWFLNKMVFALHGSKFDTYSIERKKAILSDYSFYISKMAHFIEYGILCFFCFLVFNCLKKYYLRYIISVLICLLYAITDEFHQMFTSGRTPRVQDVMIDTLGAIAMALCIELIITIINIRKLGKKYD